MTKQPLPQKRIYIGIAILVALLDQLFKFLAKIYLIPGEIIELIPNFISLMYVENPGVSFSFLSNVDDAIRVPLLIGLTFVIIVGLLVYIWKDWLKLGNFEKLGYALILGGALGNFWDRVFYHKVTDFMYFHYYEKGFFINNFADDAISIGFVFLLFELLYQKKKK